MKEWVGTAKTAEEAFARGLKKLGLSSTQVDMKVLSERTSGLLSLFGYRQAKVRIVEKARRLDRGERTENADEYDRSSHSLEYRRSGPKGRRDDRSKDEKPARPNERERKGRPSDGRSSDRPDDRRRGPKDAERVLPREIKADKNRPQKSQRPPPSGKRTGPKPPPPENRTSPLKEGSKEQKRPSSGSAGSFHPPVPPETLLAQWRTLLGWDDLTWDMKPVENHRLSVALKTSHGERLAGSGGRALEAFEYLFNLVSSGGDREKPWVSFRVAGFPSAEESRVVDKALFAAFQVRRTAKVFHLDPMSAGQRRAVHQTLIHHPDVETASEGEGAARHVVVKPKEKK
jgi:spoIIIJ-associated protein